MGLFSSDEDPSWSVIYGLQDALGELQNKLAQLPEMISIHIHKQAVEFYCDGMDYEYVPLTRVSGIGITELELASILAATFSIFGYKQTFIGRRDGGCLIAEFERTNVL
jgi:hypothetical protein